MTNLAVDSSKDRNPNGKSGLSSESGRKQLASARTDKQMVESSDPAWFLLARARMNSSGYVERFLPVGKNVLIRRMEHIIVWEIVNGKKVPDGWVIHHVDERKNNNDPSNLVALPPRIHRELHVKLRQLAGEYDGVLYSVRRFELTQAHLRRATQLDEMRKYWCGL